jgi:hypothetical protein
MPFLYTASTISAKRVQNPAFTRKGLDGLTSGRLEQLQHVGLAVEKQLAYDGYITNLPAFLHATATQSKVSVAHGWYLPKISADNLLPIPFPPLAVSSRKPFLMMTSSDLRMYTKLLLNFDSRSSRADLVYYPDAG